jgi:hypothetical protein
MTVSSAQRVDHGGHTHRLVGPLLMAFGLAAVATVWLAGSASAASGTVSIAPTAGKPTGPYSDGETVTVSVGANSTFQPGSRVNILECADPGGSPANLPKRNSTCDGLTIQGDTVLVHSDGSVSAPGYTLYRLPSPTLGEQANAQPVCDQNNVCVLYVGENQDDFSAPKLFSAPFEMAGSASAGSSSPSSPGLSTSGGGAPGSTVGGTSAGHAAATSVSDPGVQLQGGSLAYTGLPPAATKWAVTGFGLILVGAAGKISLRRAVYR